MIESAGKAVFLSYASEDAAAAQRICETLRRSGLQVWFDQSELRGGDAWDQKIRKQIKECALFVPVISANTQTRLEGYFRLEWKLAEDRSHLMAKGKPFIIPVTIDGTSERGAHVPDSVLAVQWTRMPAGDVSPAFVKRVRALLGGPEAEAVGLPADQRKDRVASPSSAARRRRFPVWTWTVVVAIALGSGGFVIFRPSAKQSTSASSEANQRFLAVLPFENISEDRDNTSVFADGMHDEVITALGKIAALKVIGRTSVLPYADPKQRNLKKIAADLGVGTVVEGTVRRAGNTVRIAVKLVDVHTLRQLWGDSFERELTNVFAIQAAVAQEVAHRLDATLTAGERTLLARRPTESPRAHELYLQAKLLNNQLTISAPFADFDRVTSALEQAVIEDPGFAQAYALQSRIHSQIYTQTEPSPSRREQARKSLDAARRLAPTAPETRLAEGRFAQNCEDEYAKALAIYQALLAELPSDDDLHFYLGTALRQLGRHTEGAVAIGKALELNPGDVSKATSMMATLTMLRRFEEALKLGQRYDGTTVQYDGIVRHTDHVRYELDGDKAKLARNRRAHPLRRFESGVVQAGYEAALIEGDLPAAARVLSDQNVTTISMNFARADPVALHRALISHLLGQREIAASHAAAAIAFYGRESTDQGRRRQVFASVGVAMAKACAGQNADALRRATAVRKDVGEKSGHIDLWLLHEVGRVYSLLGEREEAFSILRTLMTGPNSLAIFGTPRLLRLDPCWSLLAADPRFDEILNAAKPL